MTDVHEADAAIRRLLMLVVKFALFDEAATDDLRAAARQAQAEFLTRHGGAIPAGVHLDAQWELAVAEAEADPQLNHTSGVSLTLPQMLPFDAGLITATPLDLDALRAAIRGAAATG